MFLLLFAFTLRQTSLVASGCLFYIILRMFENGVEENIWTKEGWSSDLEN
jgi:hypothetical protein